MARQPQPERVPVETKLYVEKDRELLQEIWELQANKSYMQTFREAFRLTLSLRRRDTSVLFDQHPWIQSQPINTTQLNYINYLIERVKELEENQQIRA